MTTVYKKEQVMPASLSNSENKECTNLYLTWVSVILEVLKNPQIMSPNSPSPTWQSWEGVGLETLTLVLALLQKYIQAS
jgi:hypothetical protein